VRVDTHIETGARVPPFYDSLLAKVIACGPDRAVALERMRRGLAATRLEGIKTNIAIQAALMADRSFAAGGIRTAYFPSFLETYLNEASTHAAASSGATS
jgi:acetyl-CoA carboxylase, biotin carboxylase subunit